MGELEVFNSLQSDRVFCAVRLVPAVYMSTYVLATQWGVAICERYLNRVAARTDRVLHRDNPRWSYGQFSNAINIDTGSIDPYPCPT